jgi:hypothetical protein
VNCRATAVLTRSLPIQLRICGNTLRAASLTHLLRTECFLAVGLVLADSILQPLNLLVACK